MVSMFGSFALVGASRNYFGIIVRLHLNHDVFLCEGFYNDISSFLILKSMWTLVSNVECWMS